MIDTNPFSPVDISVSVQNSDGNEIHISLQNLLDMAGLSMGKAESVTLSVTQNNNSLLARTDIHNLSYPGITVDARDSHGRDIWLSMSELPNKDSPNAIVTRNYAGYADFETDEPIARVSTKLYSNRLPDYLHIPAKYVYVNEESAKARIINFDDQEPEHVEDDACYHNRKEGEGAC